MGNFLLGVSACGRSKAICRQLSADDTEGRCLRCASYPAIFTRSPIPSACYNCYQTSVCCAGSASREQWKVHVRYDHICNLPHISHIICSCCSRLTCSEFLIVANGAICFSYMPELIYDRELGCQAICRKTKRIPGY